MTLWNIIRDFFVQYIFGGITSTGDSFYGNIVGYSYVIDNDSVTQWGLLGTDTTLFKYNFITEDYGGTLYLSLGDWLSTTATIITLCAICVFLFYFVRWLFRLTAGLVSGRG